MSLEQVLILSIVEGVTEFLPVSSTGHLILASNILGIKETEFTKSFDLIIQLGAIAAVASLYMTRLLGVVRVWQKVIAAFVPTAVVGLIFYKIIKQFLLGNSEVVIGSLLIGGMLMIILEKFFKNRRQNLEKIEDLKNYQAVFIGLTQSISVIPGVSRAAATIFAGLGTGLSRKTAVEFSFLLAIPTMLGAVGLDLFKTRLLFLREEYFLMMIGFIGAFITAMITVKIFIKYIENHSFMSFAVYRIVLAAIFLIILQQT